MTELTSLRIAVFGVPRSGKDYSIMKVIEAMSVRGMEIVHYPGVQTASDYSLPVLGKEFSSTTMEEKGRLMDTFRRKVLDREATQFLIQDEHYCYPVLYGGRPLVNEYTSAKFPFILKKGPGGSPEYEVMLKEEWITDCDMIFYLRPGPEVVKERMLKSTGAKRNIQITEEDIKLWMEFEIDSLKEICAEHGLFFEVLEGDDGAYERITRRICGVMDISVSSSAQSPTTEEYRINETWITERSEGFDKGGNPYGPEDHFRNRAGWIDEALSDLDFLCSRKGVAFDLDSMTETKRSIFKRTLKTVREINDRSPEKKIDISKQLFINERIIGDSLNSIPTPHQMGRMFAVSPMAGVLCLGKSARMLANELYSEHAGLEHSSYSDLLMKLKKGKYIKSKDYDLLQGLENQRRHYATTIIVDAPDPVELAKWEKIHSKLLKAVFAPKEGRKWK